MPLPAEQNFADPYGAKKVPGACEGPYFFYTVRIGKILSVIRANLVFTLNFTVNF